MTKGWVWGVCALSVLSLIACKKGDGDSTGADTSATDGCGKDFADPGKQFCITVPSGWKNDAPKAVPPLYSELITIKGAGGTAESVTVSTGVSNTSYKSYDDELAGSEKLMKMESRKSVTSGATPGSAGKWWSYTDRDFKMTQSVAKAPNGLALLCTTAGQTPSAAAVDACKSIRPYPTKK